MSQRKPFATIGRMSREYRQFCGLARAMEVVGGRWALLIVRDLLCGPKRFKDLQTGLPGIPTNVLSARLHELEDAGVVRRRVLSRPSTGVAYELTEYGVELEEAVIRLGVWGARSMGPLREGDFQSVHALSLGLRGMFDAKRAKGVDRSFELRIDGQSLHVELDDGQLSFPATPAKEPDVVIELVADAMHALLTGQITIDKATACGRAQVRGRRTDARRFFELFHMAPPVASAASS